MQTDIAFIADNMLAKRFCSKAYSCDTLATAIFSQSNNMKAQQKHLGHGNILGVDIYETRATV